MQDLHDAFIAGRPESAGEYVVQRKDGELRTVRVTASLLVQENGARFKVTTVTDITEDKQRRERLRLLESAVEHANDVAILTKAQPLDEPGPRIVYVNPAFTETTGYTAEEAIGRSPRFLQGHDTDPAKRKRIRTALEAREPVVVELKNYTKAGEPFWVELSIVPVIDEAGACTHFLSVQRDVTDRHAYEQQLRYARDEAEAAREEAESMNRLKSAFLANMSHEIRTPLTSILGFSEVLLDDVAEEHQHFMELIVRSGQRLMRTLNSVLDLARIEAGEMPLTPTAFDLATQMEAAIRLFEPTATREGLDLRFDRPNDPVTVHLDEGALDRIVDNLTSNAIKFTREGHVHVALHATDAVVQIDVADTGIGIGHAFLPHLFEAFKQESTGMGRSFEGTGLGLKIVHRLVTMMGGTIDVESAPGQGTTFSVRLPRQLGHPMRGRGGGL
jgi:PAS domain S-box-containing protein